MIARLAPYLRYYAGRRPIEDHGLLPHVMVLFEDELAATHFLRVAQRAMASAQVAVPLFVSDSLTIKCQGPLGAAWRSAEHHSAVAPF